MDAWVNNQPLMPRVNFTSSGPVTIRQLSIHGFLRRFWYFGAPPGLNQTSHNRHEMLVLLARQDWLLPNSNKSRQPPLVALLLGFLWVPIFKILGLVTIGQLFVYPWEYWMSVPSGKETFQVYLDNFLASCPGHATMKECF